MMSDYEICQSYRQAKDKRKQIFILAQLNTAYYSRIIKILKENGALDKGRGCKSDNE